MAELEAARATVAEAESAQAAARASADTSRAQLSQLETRLLDAQCGPSFHPRHALTQNTGALGWDHCQVGLGHRALPEGTALWADT